MSNHGGSRKGAGRKMGSGLSSKIKKHVDSFMEGMMDDEDIREYALKESSKMLLHSGWIYLIQDDSTGHTKIGVTQKKNPNSRLSQYRSHNMDISLIFLDWVDYCYEVERILHSMVFQSRVGNSDWFNLEDVEVLVLLTELSKQKNPKYHG